MMMGNHDPVGQGPSRKGHEDHSVQAQHMETGRKGVEVRSQCTRPEDAAAPTCMLVHSQDQQAYRGMPAAWPRTKEGEPVSTEAPPPA